MNIVRTLINAGLALTAGAFFIAAETPAPAPVRIGIAAPTDRMSTDGSNAAALRELTRKYLQGPGIEAVALDAPLPALAEAEAKSKGCAYTLFLTFSQKTGGRGFNFSRGASLLSSAAPVVNMTGGMGGIIATTAASAAVNGASTVAGSVKARSEVTVEYKLIATGGTGAPLAANTLKAKAKQDAEDVITPLVMQTDSEIVKAIAH